MVLINANQHNKAINIIYLSNISGTTVAQLRCVDPEGDLIFYSKKAGDAFIVTQNGSVILTKALDFDVRFFFFFCSRKNLC